MGKEQKKIKRITPKRDEVVVSKIVDMKISPEEVMDDLQKQLRDNRDRPDEDFWYDRLNFINSNCIKNSFVNLP